MNAKNRAATRVMDHKKQAQSILMGILITIPLFYSGCGTTKPICSMTGATGIVTLDQESKIFVFPPQFLFSSLETEAPLTSGAYDASLYESKLKSESERIVRDHHIKTEDAGVCKQILTSDILDDLQKKIPSLAVGRIDSESDALLKTLASYDEDMVILVEYVDVKVGSDGSWNPNSGAITMSNSRSEFYTALIDCNAGHVVWKNQVLLRELPKRSSKRFDEAVELLFTNFPAKEN